jgi:exopolysaccharide production protein ExoY
MRVLAVDQSALSESAHAIFESRMSEMFDVTAIAPFADPDAITLEPKRSNQDRNRAAGSGAVGGFTKRGFDIAAALLGMILCGPLLVSIAVLIKIINGGPVVFRHARIGFDGKRFSCLKFRTMVNNADEVLTRHITANSAAASEWATTQKLRNDPRLTALGSILRKTCIDELPQLFNILKGDMSLVGPRPIVAAEMSRYGVYIGDYLRVRPGLTGAWQVSDRTNLEYAGRVRLDHEYVHNWSFRRDMVIITKTIGVVLRGEGCY